MASIATSRQVDAIKRTFGGRSIVRPGRAEDVSLEALLEAHRAHIKRKRVRLAQQGHVGIKRIRERDGRFEATVQHGGVEIPLGAFGSWEEARRACVQQKAPPAAPPRYEEESDDDSDLERELEESEQEGGKGGISVAFVSNGCKSSLGVPSEYDLDVRTLPPPLPLNALPPCSRPRRREPPP